MLFYSMSNLTTSCLILRSPGLSMKRREYAYRARSEVELLHVCGQCWDDCGLGVGHLAGVHRALYYLPGKQAHDKMRLVVE